MSGLFQNEVTTAAVAVVGVKETIRPGRRAQPRKTTFHLLQTADVQLCCLLFYPAMVQQQLPSDYGVNAVVSVVVFEADPAPLLHRSTMKKRLLAALLVILFLAYPFHSN